MKTSLSWLRDFVPGLPLPTADDSEINALADTLSDLGLAVEGVERTGPGDTWDGIVVALITGLRPHPQADRIQLVDVITEPGSDSLQICCGAWNLSVGDFVPLATLGTTMANGMHIERRKMRGEWSNGMLCSGEELGVSSDHDGIHLLEGSEADLGRPLIDALGVEADVVFDLDVTGNRPEAMSVLGVARDVAARLGLPCHEPQPEVAEVDGPPASDLVGLDIIDADLCPRFGVRVLRGVSTGPSPTWMADRLVAAGMRPINLVVDISNYVMLELGQPNHTYDLDAVAGQRLGARWARDGEELETLDGQTRSLTSADGVIVDGNDTPIGLAGVMGGASTEISAATNSVLLETAVWHRMAVARTSRRLGLRSEASTRFERGVDPLGIERGLDRFCQLASELCGAEIVTGRVVAEGDWTPPSPITVPMAMLNRIIAAELDGSDVARLIEPIGFGVEASSSDVVVTPPTYRPDVTIAEDIAEEVARQRGYGESGKRVPVPTQSGALTSEQRRRRRIHGALRAVGHHEAMPMPFLAPGDPASLGQPEDFISVTNPLVAEESVLRTSLLAGLLKAVAHNQAHRMPAVRLYEIGSVWARGDAEADLPDEQRRIALISSGYGPDGGAAAEMVATFWRFVGALSANPSQIQLSNQAAGGLHPSRSAVVRVRGQVVGEIGEVDPDISAAHGIDGRVGWCQVDLDAVVAIVGSGATYQRVSRMPSSDFDVAVVVADEISVTDVARTIRRAAGAVARDVDLFDVYRGDGVADGTRSLAFRIRLQADDRTLDEVELSAIRQAIIDDVRSRHKAVLR